MSHERHMIKGKGSACVLDTLNPAVSSQWTSGRPLGCTSGLAVERLLSDLCEECFGEALRHGSIVEELPPSLHSRAVATYHTLLNELTDVNARLQILIHAAEVGDTSAYEQLKEELARTPSDRIRDNREIIVKSDNLSR